MHFTEQGQPFHDSVKCNKETVTDQLYSPLPPKGERRDKHDLPPAVRELLTGYAGEDRELAGALEDLMEVRTAKKAVNSPRAVRTLLGKMGVDSVLAEGGAQLHWGLVQAGLVNRVQAYLAPKLLGGQGAKSPVGGQGFPHPDQALSLSSPTLTRLGEDILLESEVTG